MNNILNTIWLGIQQTIRGEGRDKLVTNAAFLFGNTVVTSLAGLVFWTIATREFTPDQNGIATSVISIFQLLVNLSGLGLGMGLLRYVQEVKNSEDLFGTILSIVSITMTIVGGLFLAFIGLLSPTLAPIFSTPLLKLVLLGWLLTSIYLAFFMNLLVAFRKTEFAFYQIAGFNLVRILAVFLFRGLGLWGLLGSIMLSNAVGLMMGVYFVSSKLDGFRIRIGLRFKRIKEVVIYSLGENTYIFLNQVPALISVPMALEMVSEDMSAYVYIIWMLVALLSGIGIALGNSALVEGAHSPEQGLNIVKRAGLIAIGATVPIAAIFYLFPNKILAIFGPGYSENGSALLKLMAIAGPIVALNWVLLTYLRLKKMVLRIVILSVFIATVSIGYTYFNLISVGILAIGQGWIIAQLSVAIYIVGLIFWKRYRREL